MFTLIPVKDYAVLVKRTYKPNKYLKLLDDFIDTAEICCVCDGVEADSVHQIAGTMRRAAKRVGKENAVDIIVRQQRLYLIRKDLTGEVSINDR